MTERVSSAFTDLVGCRLPLQQAPVGACATPQMVIAVGEAGGLGTLPMRAAEPLTVRIDQVRGAGPAPFAVNFLMPFVSDDTLAEIDHAAAQARMVEFFYGTPDPSLVARVHRGGALACWQVGSIDEAHQAVDAGCDLLVLQGIEAGGHVRGTAPLIELVTAVRPSVEVPLVGAGGISTRGQALAALEAGADAVRAGTRFVATEESAAHPVYVDALVRASGTDDTVLTDAFSVGWPDAPHRVLRSAIAAAEALEGDEAGVLTLGDRDLVVPRWFVAPPTVDVRGVVEAMALYAGTGVGAIEGTRTVADVVAELTGDEAS